MTQHWKNTVSGIREKRMLHMEQSQALKQLQKQREMEEFQREEAILREQKLQEAKSKMFMEREDVKAFHSGVLYHQVLKV
jgi:hypothetical protein